MLVRSVKYTVVWNKQVMFAINVIRFGDFLKFFVTNIPSTFAQIYD